MFEAGDLIANTITGQHILICKTERDTHGAYVEVEYFHRPYSGKSYSPRHFHPTWSEHFEILTGLTGLPIPIQRPLLSLLAAVGQAAGYQVRNKQL